MKFSYSSGQRPLDGYTIKRGIGRGGFGEVYFALSDGGKEVALKLVRGDDNVELRGVAQCLNLKHPNLVALYDLRTDAHGDKWVVMEYVAGEPLNVVLGRHPGGLPRELVREWFLALARAVAYLHDQGIVHRDLKPANVFLENSTVKVGDYGLSKSISTSQRTAQTQSVGTVHYMAPEISTGNYNKQIDTYAAGVILYEMLTGRVPFDGESCGEILMKHLTTPPDLRKVPAEWQKVVEKALSKNPAHRYATMAEMARDVEAVGQGAWASSRTPAPAPAAPKNAVPVAERLPVAGPRRPEPVLNALPAHPRRDLIAELCGSMALTVLFAALASALWAALSHQVASSQVRTLAQMSTLFFLTVLASWAILVPAKFWTERRAEVGRGPRNARDSWSRRVVMMVLGGLVGLIGLWLDGWALGGPALGEEPTASGVLVPLFQHLSRDAVTEASYFSYYALAFFALRWWRMTARHRSQRFSFAPILAAGFWGVVLLLVVRLQEHGTGAVVLVLASAIVQLVSPWEPLPTPERQPRRVVLPRPA